MITNEQLAEIKDYVAKGALRIDLDQVRFRLLAATDNRNLSVQQCVEMFPAFLRVMDELAVARTDLPLLVAEISRLQNQIALLEQDVRDAELFLMRQDYKRCDIAACNCGSWHKRTI